MVPVFVWYYFKVVYDRLSLVLATLFFR
uniref:Uncharacterized protein n=1 Tax=Rhizophora mucronata TaxID=61149 RepID=A0A2P2MX45_RHIMU